MKKRAFLFSNGAMIVTDGEEQIPELNQSALELWAEHATRLGYDPTEYTWKLPCGGEWRIFKTTEGDWNYRLEE